MCSCFSSFLGSHTQKQTHTHTKCSTSLPSTLSPSNTPCDSAPARSACLFPSPHPQQQNGSGANQRRVSQVGHQWHANYMFHIWDLMNVYWRPGPIEDLYFTTLKHTRNTKLRQNIKILSFMVPVAKPLIKLPAKVVCLTFHAPKFCVTLYSIIYRS